MIGAIQNNQLAFLLPLSYLARCDSCPSPLLQVAQNPGSSWKPSELKQKGPHPPAEDPKRRRTTTTDSKHVHKGSLEIPISQKNKQLKLSPAPAKSRSHLTLPEL